MKQVLFSNAVIGEEAARAMVMALANIKAGNAAIAAGKKLADSGKEYLAEKLKTLREIDVAKLPIGEIVCVEMDGAPLFNIIIGKQNRLDLATLEAEQPEIARQYKKDFATISYKSAR